MIDDPRIAIAAGAIFDCMSGGRCPDWRTRLDMGDHCFLESADWQTCVEYAQAAATAFVRTNVTSREVTQDDRDAAARLYEWGIMKTASAHDDLKKAQFIRDGGADGWNTVLSYRNHRLLSAAGVREAHEMEAPMKYPVIQADRDAAQRLIGGPGGSLSFTWRDGEQDNGATVQAFAEHRIRCARDSDTHPKGGDASGSGSAE